MIRIFRALRVGLSEFLRATRQEYGAKSPNRGEPFDNTPGRLSNMETEGSNKRPIDRINDLKRRR